MIDPISPLASAGAEKTLGVSGASQAARPGTAAKADTPDFESVLGKLITDGADILRAAESTAIKGVMGEASVQEVVESVLAAEQTLQAAIAIRDKVTAAYLELSRMAI